MGIKADRIIDNYQLFASIRIIKYLLTTPDNKMAKFAVVLCTLIVSLAARSEASNAIVDSIASSGTNLITYLSAESQSIQQPLKDTYQTAVSNLEMFDIDVEYETGVILKAHDAALTSDEYSEDALSCADSTLEDQAEKIIADAQTCSGEFTADLTTKYEQYTATLEELETYLNDQLVLAGSCWTSDYPKYCWGDILNDVASSGISQWFDVLTTGEEVVDSYIEWNDIPSLCQFDTAKSALQTQADASVAAVQQCAANA